MNICVAGWHYGPSIKFLKEHWGTVVGHRPNPIADVVIPNVGLEFGCYDWYLKHKWSCNRTFFTHDDNVVTPRVLDAIEDYEDDQAFLFSSEEEAKQNGNAHGRAFVCSDRFLERLKADGGFWYDEGNHGDVAPTNGNPDYHNNGIIMFLSYLKSLPKEWSVNQVRIVPGLITGYRGEVKRG